ncbi:MAG: hypothetical protein HWD58_20225 [Bacteroidota bacterium]|nr:MAG: hypothetical protein HWD58_20225 [Bacteroidota bacterium]
MKRLFGNYVNGQRNGDWEVFNENGSIQVIYHYEKGKVVRVTDYW